MTTDPTAARIAELIASTRKWAEYGCPDMKYAMADAVLLCDMAERCEAAEARVAELEGRLAEISRMLTIPAAEYVPAIGDVFTLIDQTLASGPAPAATPPEGG